MRAVIGAGEIGTSLANVMGCPVFDKEGVDGEYNVIHIAFPYFEGFEYEVEKYRQQANADLVIIHSTVPVGTSSVCRAVHSPVRGVHPNLERSLKSFVKFCGGDRSAEAKDELKQFGIPAVAVEKSEDTEAGKLWSTTGYGLNIILEKAIHAYCEKNGLDFDVVYRMFNNSYNSGYEIVGMPQFKKYNLKHKEGRIGGHCIESNAKLLDADLADDLLRYIGDYTN